MNSSATAKILFDKTAMAEAVNNVVEAIISEFSGNQLKDLAFIGIQLHGEPFAKRIVEKLNEHFKFDFEMGTLDISMYRDDIGMRKTLPIIHETKIPFDINDRIIVLTDDVLQSGRTIRAALDAITDYGRPRLIRLAALIDRGNREFPIHADYTGKTCQVSVDKSIRVKMMELDGEDAVYEINREVKSK
jgi:pyrimidine operon attenuation protein/uracil phosphoribosyltransferase